jgi:hypothetical protein
MMIKAKMLIWVATGITALALSATTIIAAAPPADGSSPRSPTDNAAVTMLRPIFQLRFGPDASSANETKQAARAEGKATDGVKPTKASAGEDEEDPNNDDQDDQNEDGDKDSSDAKIAGLASYFKVGLNTVTDLRDKEGLGYGEIYKALQIAASGAITGTETITDSLKLVLDARDGQGWGQVYKQFGLQPGNHGDNFGSIMSGRGITDTVPITDTGKLRVDAKVVGKDKVNGNNNGNGNGKKR